MIFCKDMLAKKLRLKSGSAQEPPNLLNLSQAGVIVNPEKL